MSEDNDFFLPSPHQVQIFRQDGAILPEQKTTGASGFDLSARILSSNGYGFTLEPGEPARIGTGLHISMPRGLEAQIRPRSGLSSKGVLVHFGTVDSDYRGELIVSLINVSKVPYTVNHGDRIAQLIFSTVVFAKCVEVEKVDDLGVTSRGSGGFGSTGR